MSKCDVIVRAVIAYSGHRQSGGEKSWQFFLKEFTLKEKVKAGARTVDVARAELSELKSKKERSTYQYLNQLQT